MIVSTYKTDSKPLVSLILLTYMQENYVEDSLNSALDQDYENLEIIITDDHSTDETYKKITEIVSNYKGPHKVIINRNKNNVGLASNINNGWLMSSGELLVIQAGDDLSLPERATDLVKIWLDSNKSLDLVFSDITTIDHSSEVINKHVEASPVSSLEDILKGKHFIAGGMSCSYSRKVISTPSFLDSRIVYEDFVLTFRALAGGGIAHYPKPLVKYRIHGDSIIGQRDTEFLWRRESTAKWAKYQLAAYQDRLVTSEYFELNHDEFTSQIKNKIAFFKLHFESSTGTRLQALCCVFKALTNLRIYMGFRLLLRDVIMH
jgi:glycosyltransferase involved in cell wall biosynthesis